MNLEHMRVKIYADTADLDYMAAADPAVIKGFTCNPSICRKSGVGDYLTFARDAARIVAPRPISLEVVADEFDQMEQQAVALARLGANVVVKIPITNTRGESSAVTIRRLAEDDVRVNVTAVFSMSQVVTAVDALDGHGGIISIFAGRIADTGRDPTVTIRSARGIVPKPIDILWASPREVWNIWEAEKAGANIITCGPDILSKLSLAGKNLEEFSLETVAMFKRDADAAGYQIRDPNSYGVSSFG